MKRQLFLAIVVLAGCGEIAGIQDLTSDEVKDAGVTPVADAGSDVVTFDVVDAPPAVDTTEADKGFRRVFVTSVGWDGDNIAGVGGGDQKCNELAIQKGFQANGEQNWFAWLSGTASAKDRIVFDGPHRLLNGTDIALNKAKFTSGSLLHAIDQDENGNGVGGEVRVWTGTEPNGNISSNNCTGWMSQDVLGMFGKCDTANGGWTNSGTTTCAIVLRLYCFEK